MNTIAGSLPEENGLDHSSNVLGSGLINSLSSLSDNPLGVPQNPVSTQLSPTPQINPLQSAGEAVNLNGDITISADPPITTATTLNIVPPIFEGCSPPVNALDGYPNKIIKDMETGALIEGAQLAFENTLFTDVGATGQQNFTFYWESHDSILGHIQATINTTAASGFERSYIQGDPSRPSRLVFTGSGGGATFSGNVIFDHYNRVVVDVLKDGKRVRYLLTTQLPEQSSPGQDPSENSDCGCNSNLAISATHLGGTEGGENGNIYSDQGEFFQWETDLYIPGNPGALECLNYSFSREYRSRYDTNGVLGQNWEHNYFERLEVQVDGSIVHNNGSDQHDRYLLNSIGGGYISPEQVFDVLTKNPDGTYTLRAPNCCRRTFDAEGQLKEIRDCNNNVLSFQYNAQNQMTRVIDTLERAIDYRYFTTGVNQGRLQEVEDFMGRKISFEYDSNGDLSSVTSPAGTTTRYTYSSGFADESLNHNLLNVIRPNEVANGGAASIINTYYTSHTNGYNFDKIHTQNYGGTNSSGVQAGGTFTYEYTLLNPGVLSGDPNQVINRTSQKDPNGNIIEFEYNPLGQPLSLKEFTNKESTNRYIRLSEPDYETKWEYNGNGMLLREIYPNSNSVKYVYDDDNVSRSGQGNLLWTERIGSGDQTSISWRNYYEPIHQQIIRSVDPRGLDPSFVPPIPDPSGRTQEERYTTQYFYDYQEADPSLILPLLSQGLGISEAEVQARLDAADVELGLGDINMDGDVSPRIAGKLIKKVDPSVVLLAGSNQEAIEGDRLQDIVTLYRYNQYGQMTSMVDPEGNIDTYEYYPNGGYLQREIIDQSHKMGANSNNGAAPTQIETSYTYDSVGNMITMTDGRGIRTEYVYNSLNQVVRTIRAAAVPGSSPDEPITLTAFSYIEDTFYDANNNVIKRSVEDRGNTSNTGGFVDTTYTYNTLDYLVQESQEVDVNTTLVTQYRYDANGNQTLTISPEGNATTSLYDERNQLFQTTNGAITATPGTLNAPVGTYNVRGGIPSTTTYNYDGNGNLVQTVDAEDTDQSTGNNSTITGVGDVTQYGYDGFNRQTTTIDAVGNETVVNYDPVGNIIRQRVYGPIGGVSPTNNSGTNNVLLSDTTYLYDELNRRFQQDQNLFVATGVSTVRTPNIRDGSLTPNDNKVTMRYEYDRNSRQTFMIQDDQDTYATLYDGADRQIKTIDPVGNTVEYAYDDNSNVIETKETDKSQIAGVADEVFLTTNFYDSLNRLQQTVNNIGQSSSYRYDSRDNLVSMADAQGPVTGATINRRAFSGGALTVNSINDFGNVTQYYYDGIGRKVREEQVLTASGKGDGVNIGATLEGVKTTTPTPDTTQGGGDGIIRTGSVYDDNSLLSALVDDQGNVTLYLYDNLNRKVAETKGLTVNSTLNKANILGNRQLITPTVATINNPAVIDATLINTQLAGIGTGISAIASLFPSLANQVDDTPPTTLVYGYSPDSNLLIFEDENDSETFTKYDAINRRIAVRIFRSGQSDSFSGDPIFAPAPVTDPSNPSTTFPAIIGTTKQDYQYDGLSRLTRATDNNDPTDSSDDSVVTYAYDSLSRVIEETQQIGSLPVQATSSGYDSDTRSYVIYPNGRTLVYTYDGLDRIKTIKDEGAAQNLAEYDYIGVGRVLERRYPTNGTRLTYLNDAGNTDIGYDGLRRVVTLRNLESDNSLIVGFEYGYDRMNNRTFKRLLHDPANSELYSYDSSYRLINFERGTLNGAGDTIITPSTTVSQGQQWNLDGVGNWDSTTIIDENGNSSVDNREHSSFNELITQNGATLRYDDNGNLVEDAEYTYSYDAFNRLRIATRKADGVVAEYSYDAMGRRIIKEVSNSGALNGVTYFYHDGNREIEERDGSNVLKQQYVYGNYIDEVLTMDRNLDGDNSAIGPSDQRFYYHQDGLFSVYAVTDNTGQIAESYLYDPYGKVTVFDGSGNVVPDNAWGTPHSAIDNPFLFTGRRLDEETGLYYYRARYYDADQGRFISRDPARGDSLLNNYAYVENNSLTWVDPNGLVMTASMTFLEDAWWWWDAVDWGITVTVSGDADPQGLKLENVKYFHNEIASTPVKAYEIGTNSFGVESTMTFESTSQFVWVIKKFEPKEINLKKGDCTMECREVEMAADFIESEKNNLKTTLTKKDKSLIGFSYQNATKTYGNVTILVRLCPDKTWSMILNYGGQPAITHNGKGNESKWKDLSVAFDEAYEYRVQTD